MTYTRGDMWLWTERGQSAEAPNSHAVLRYSLTEMSITPLPRDTTVVILCCPDAARCVETVQRYESRLLELLIV